jgi:hypothetical protein
MDDTASEMMQPVAYRTIERCTAMWAARMQAEIRFERNSRYEKKMLLLRSGCLSRTEPRTCSTAVGPSRAPALAGLALVTRRESET